MNIELLQKWKDMATIFSLIAVPIIVAVATQAIQNRIAEEGARKDYVTLAIGILTKNKEEQPDIELRQWAVDIVDKSAPVKLSGSLKTKLGNGGATLTVADVVSIIGDMKAADERAALPIELVKVTAKKKKVPEEPLSPARKKP